MTKDDYQCLLQISESNAPVSIRSWERVGVGISLAMTAQGWGNRHATSSRENN